MVVLMLLDRGAPVHFSQFISKLTEICILHRHYTYLLLEKYLHTYMLMHVCTKVSVEHLFHILKMILRTPSLSPFFSLRTYIFSMEESERRTKCCSINRRRELKIQNYDIKLSIPSIFRELYINSCHQNAWLFYNMERLSLLWAAECYIIQCYILKKNSSQNTCKNYQNLFLHLKKFSSWNNIVICWRIFQKLIFEILHFFESISMNLTFRVFIINIRRQFVQQIVKPKYVCFGIKSSPVIVCVFLHHSKKKMMDDDKSYVKIIYWLSSWPYTVIRGVQNGRLSPPPPSLWYL